MRVIRTVLRGEREASRCRQKSAQNAGDRRTIGPATEPGVGQPSTIQAIIPRGANSPRTILS